MLRHAPKGAVDGAEALTPEEDAVLRAAFGRYGGGLAHRQAAAPLVARAQGLGGGQWLLCDCRPGATRPPALIPVAMTHIRRHDDPRWARHAEGCDFHREPAEQRAITESHAAARTRPFRLARRFEPLPVPARPPETRTCSHSHKRPGLARLVMRLVTEAGLQAVPPGWRAPPLVEQVKAIWSVARAIDIDHGVRLTDRLCTGLAKLPQLMERIAREPETEQRATRPHGVLVVRLARVGDGMIEPVAGPALPVLGRLSVFGEDAAGATTARAPYLAACVVGRVEAGGPVGIVSAYVHPCAAEAHLMLVDSDRERRTLEQLRSVQGWLLRKRGIGVTIEKPLFDLGPPGGPEATPRPPCIPDFVLRGGPATVIVETMGYADEGYRGRKERVHPALSAALAGAPVVLHDFHRPPGRDQAWSDARFWRELRWAVTGPEAAPGGTPRRAPPGLRGSTDPARISG